MKRDIMLHGAKVSTIRAVVFDLGGVLIDLHSNQARRELIDEYGLATDRFERLTRSCFTARRRSITELAMIGKATTAEYLAGFSHCLWPVERLSELKLPVGYRNSIETWAKVS